MDEGSGEQAYSNAEAAVKLIRDLDAVGLVDGNSVVLGPMILPVQRNVWRVYMRVRSNCMLVRKQASPSSSRQAVCVPAFRIPWRFITLSL